jgi:hypothetical protein
MKCKTVLMLVMVSSVLVGQDKKRLDGNELLPQCKAVVRLANNEHLDRDRDSTSDMQYCIGLVTGVSDMLDICGESTYGQSIRIVVKYLEEHPEKLNLKATLLVKQALLGALGCKAK